MAKGKWALGEIQMKAPSPQLSMTFLILALPCNNLMKWIGSLPYRKNKMRINAIRPVSRAKRWLSKKIVKLELILFNFLCNYRGVKYTG